MASVSIGFAFMQKLNEEKMGHPTCQRSDEKSSDSLTTVARWPKILQNNTKRAATNIFGKRKTERRTAPNFDQKWQKRGWKIFSNCF